jgi:hypothetical protein
MNNYIIFFQYLFNILIFFFNLKSLGKFFGFVSPKVELVFDNIDFILFFKDLIVERIQLFF